MSRCSIMEFFGQDDGHKCGYCKSEGSSISHGMWAHSMTVLEYQTLIDQGWRRSGRYLYKPEMSKTCCPQYTIKLAVKDFKPSKSHKKVLRKLRNYISRDKGGPKGGDQIDGGDSSDDSMDVTDSAEPKETATARMELAQSKIKAAESELSHVTATPEPSIGPSSSEPNDKDDRVDGANPTTSGPPSSSSSSKTLSEAASSAALPPPKRGLGADPNKPKARKAKELRRERAEKKGKIPQKREPKNKEKGLSDFIDAPFPPDAKHTFELRMISAQTEDPEFMRSFNESYNVYKKYQVAIHKDKPDSITKKQFTRFLCNSSLIQEPIPRSGSPGKQFGAYHQQYLIDGRIVCVGVVDVLSSCVSSVYLYYDPDFAFLSPGVFTSLYEIHYVSTLEQFDIPFYYMGFYIHSCPKMR